MSAKLNKNLYDMLKGDLLKEELFIEKDIDKLLDSRDEEDFDKKWMEVYHHIENLKDRIKDNKLIDEIRKEAFLKSHILSKSSELASYVSDDFELISKAIEIGYDNKWLNGLFSCYLSSIFPCGIINNENVSIESQIKKYINDKN